MNSAISSFTDSDLIISGENFTKWSKVFVNDKKVNTVYYSSGCLTINKDDLQDGDTIKVCQMGSKDTIFRSSNEITYVDPSARLNTQEPASETE